MSLGASRTNPSGKPQDGWVSRNINRPISGRITRWLLKFPITPSAWTWSITPLAIAGALLFSRGEYGCSIAAALLFQLYSIVDGCDGEIARAKDLASEAGRRLDLWCDTVASLLLVLGVGYGLARTGSTFSIVESIVAAAFILGNEVWLAVQPEPDLERAGTDFAYPRHREILQQSGLGERFTFVVVQVTKRDVAILFFVLLAVVNQTAWIIHLLLAAAAVTLALALKAGFHRLRARTR
ncbi:MAG: CDP-alcohol phosphatidyltransferase family protein [Verrucomicrobiota bacterium]|nr:CDP-alcohol phosphatidyltransferase family protein [Verrucomicrobiota bacterium]